MGAALGPQLVGAVTDLALASDGFVKIAESLHLGLEQLAMKTGLLVGSIFPLLAIAVYASMHRQQTKKSE